MKNPLDLRTISQFQSLADIWEKDRPRGVDVAEMVMHPAYQHIIGMGKQVVPLLLDRLIKKPNHWFWALHAITGENPVVDCDAGNPKKMTEAWIQWGLKQGYISELDCQ